MSICEIPSKKKTRERIYGWFKEWVATLDNETVERLLKFITGTTRTPLPRKISVCKYFTKNFFIFKRNNIK